MKKRDSKDPEAQMQKYNEIRNRAWKRLRPELENLNSHKMTEEENETVQVNSSSVLPSLQNNKRPVTQNTLHARS
mgnify:CR=1 FL=1